MRAHRLIRPLMLSNRKQPSNSIQIRLHFAILHYFDAQISFLNLPLSSPVLIF